MDPAMLWAAQGVIHNVGPILNAAGQLAHSVATLLLAIC